jgi:hypothetical protein
MNEGMQVPFFAFSPANALEVDQTDDQNLIDTAHSKCSADCRPAEAFETETG